MFGKVVEKSMTRGKYVAPFLGSQVAFPPNQ